MQSPSHPEPRRAKTAISLVFFVFGALVGGWLPHIPDMQRQLHLNYEQLGSALLCTGLGAVVTMPLLGWLIHRFGSRPVLLFGGFGACALVPLLLLQRSLVGTCINLGALGACYGCLDVAMNAHSVHVQGLHERPMLSAVHGWFSIGGIAGGLGASLFVALQWSAEAHLWSGSAALAGTLVVSMRGLLGADTDRGEEGPRLVFPKGVLLALGLLTICAFVAEGGVLDWIALFVRTSLHAPAQFGGIATAVCSFAMAAGRFAGDPLLHRFGNLRVVVVGGFIGCAGLGAGAQMGNLWVSLPLICIGCIGISNMVPVFFKASGAVPGMPTGTALAAVTTCGYAGFLLGPPLIGNLANHVSLRFAMGGLGAMGLIVSLTAPLVLRDRFTGAS